MTMQHTYRREDLDFCHPLVKQQFINLAADLGRAFLKGELTVPFVPFETYRGPERQRYLYELKDGRTGADMYQSAHQFGMAVDFVPKPDGRWSWDEKHPWGVLHAYAKKHGLLRPYSWDLAHIEAPQWADFRDILRRL